MFTTKFSCFFVFFHGSLSIALLITAAGAEAIDPLQELDVLSSHRMHNHHQCQRLCWYWKPCGRYSFYSKNDDRPSRDNCVLHRRQQKVPDLVDGWFDEVASGQNLSPDQVCSPRPCEEHTICIPVYGNKKHVCANISTGAWVGHSCSLTCHSPPSAGNTSCFHGECLCAAGYYYSVSRRACVATCGDLGNSYLRYEGYDLYGYDASQLLAVNDVADCKAWCAPNPQCLMFVHVEGLKSCFSKYVTALDHPDRWRHNSGVVAYQKTCA